MLGDSKVLVLLCKKIQSSLYFNWPITVSHYLAIMDKAMQS